jgi:hypothetical protein
MPHYKVLQKSFINNTVHEEDAIIEYDGVAGSNLELIVDRSKSKAKSVDQQNNDTPGEDSVWSK